MTLGRFHPVTEARSRAHARNQGSCPANGRDGNVADCSCEPTEQELAEEWSGRARMAAARRAAGMSLSAIDRQALDRYPHNIHRVIPRKAEPPHDEA